MRPTTPLFIFLCSCLGLSTAACNSLGGQDARPVPAPALEGLSGPRPPAAGADGPSGSTGNNGIKPEVYHAYKKDLTAAMRVQLTSAPGVLNKQFDVIPDTNPDTVELVSYAVDCAASGAFTFGPSTTAVSGHKILSTTDSWLTGALPNKQQRELHACIAARLNPTGQTVTLWFGGLNVIDDPTVDPKEFTVDEAYWATMPSQDEPFAIHVWPSDTLRTRCESKLNDALTTRVCARGLSCGLIPRTDRAKCDSPGDRTGTKALCPANPGDPPTVEVIRTRMRCDAWCTLYPSCTLPTECIDAGIPPCPSSP